MKGIDFFITTTIKQRSPTDNIITIIPNTTSYVLKLVWKKKTTIVTLTDEIVSCDQYATSEEYSRGESVVRSEYGVVNVGLVDKVTHLNEAGYSRQHREYGHFY